MKEEPPAGTKCKDKFLVQSAIITPDRETKTLAELVSRPYPPYTSTDPLVILLLLTSCMFFLPSITTVGDR